MIMCGTLTERFNAANSPGSPMSGCGDVESMLASEDKTNHGDGEYWQISSNNIPKESVSKICDMRNTKTKIKTC